ncbi:MAG: hypothetical protein WC329_02870 [Candidatus Omnitrophota bacterium]|jgi:hypothetical protein
MKVIRKANANWRPWWVGKQITCEECGQIVELEDGDENMVNVRCTIDGDITIRCESCGTTIMLEKKEVKK